jgi:hypothetical protein
MTAAEQKSMVLAVFADLADNDDVDGLFDFMGHCGIDVRKMRIGQVLTDFILEHYQIGARKFDVSRVVEDLATYPPIVQRVEELRTGQTENSQLISKKTG